MLQSVTELFTTTGKSFEEEQICEMAVFRVSGKKFVFEKGLGQGGFGTVSLVRDAVTAELFALKDIACDTGDSNAVKDALDEIKTLRSLSHPNRVLKCDVTKI